MPTLEELKQEIDEIRAELDSRRVDYTLQQVIEKLNSRKLVQYLGLVYSPKGVSLDGAITYLKGIALFLV